MERNNSRLHGLFIPAVVGLMLYLAGCTKENTFRVYHSFPEKSWERFDVLDIEIPVDSAPENWDLIINVWFTDSFEPYELPLYVVWEHPSGEERISEYQIKVRDQKEIMLLPCNGDSCSGKVIVQRSFRNLKRGIIRMQIENLNPKMITQGISGLEVLLKPSGK